MLSCRSLKSCWRNERPIRSSYAFYKPLSCFNICDYFQPFQKASPLSTPLESKDWYERPKKFILGRSEFQSFISQFVIKVKKNICTCGNFTTPFSDWRYLVAFRRRYSRSSRAVVWNSAKLYWCFWAAKNFGAEVSQIFCPTFISLHTVGRVAKFCDDRPNDFRDYRQRKKKETSAAKQNGRRPERWSVGHNQIITRSWVVAVIADRTAYDARPVYRPLSGIALVGMSIYLFTVSNRSQMLMLASFVADHCFLWLKYTSYSKSVWRSE